MDAIACKRAPSGRLRCSQALFLGAAFGGFVIYAAVLQICEDAGSELQGVVGDILACMYN